MFRAAVIDDDPEIADLIKGRINKTDIVICSGVYKDPLSYINSDFGIKDHIVLLDVLMPEMNGIDAIPHLLNYNPDLTIIINTIQTSSDVIFKALKAGALGYIDKQSTAVNYKDVFTALLNGGAYLTPSIAFKIVNNFKSKSTTHLHNLTERENDVAEKIKEGMSYSEIGDELSISINTVRMHIKKIYTKLQINSKFELMNLKWGIN